MKDLLSKEHYFYKIHTLMKQRQPPIWNNTSPFFTRKLDPHIYMFEYLHILHIYVYKILYIYEIYNILYIIYKSFVQKTEKGNRLKYIK